MRISWQHVALKIPQDLMRSLLDDWRWLVDESYSPVVVTSMGNMILSNAEGHMFLLDTGGCELLEVANSMSEFQKAISNKKNAQAWFLTNILGDLLESGASLQPNECFGYKVPPILSGIAELSNFEPTDVAVHFSICGQLGEQARDLPPGTVVSGFTVDDDNGNG